MTTRHLSVLPILALLATTLPAQTTPTAADEPAGTFIVGTGFDFSRGDYGLADDTEVTSVPLVLGYERGSWLFEARVPWIRIEGPATVIAGGGTAVRPTSSAESGVGDLTLSSTYRVGEIGWGVNSSATVRAKLPTADEDRGLGTGKTDFSGQVDFYRAFGRLIPFVSLGYTALGDSALYQLEDGPYATGGLNFRLSDSTILTTAYSWRHRFVDGGEHGRDAIVAITHDFSPRWRLMVYGLKGFTTASPNEGGGLQLTARF